MAQSNYTEADLRDLDDAIASGELVSKHQDRSVTYRDLDEMLRIRQLMVEDIKASKSETSGRSARRMYRLCVDDGL